MSAQHRYQRRFKTEDGSGWEHWEPVSHDRVCDMVADNYEDQELAFTELMAGKHLRTPFAEYRKV